MQQSCMGASRCRVWLLEHWVEGRFGFRSRLSSVALVVLSSSAVGCPHGCGRGCGSGRVAWRGALCVGEQLDAFLGLPSWRVCAAVGVTCACPSPVVLASECHRWVLADGRSSRGMLAIRRYWLGELRAISLGGSPRHARRRLPLGWLQERRSRQLPSFTGPCRHSEGAVPGLFLAFVSTLGSPGWGARI